MNPISIYPDLEIAMMGFRVSLMEDVGRLGFVVSGLGLHRFVFLFRDLQA